MPRQGAVSRHAFKNGHHPRRSQAPPLHNHLAQKSSCLCQQKKGWITPERRRTSRRESPQSDPGAWAASQACEQRQWEPGFQKNSAAPALRVSRPRGWTRAYKHPREALTSAAHSSLTAPGRCPRTGPALAHLECCLSLAGRSVASCPHSRAESE